MIAEMDKMQWVSLCAHSRISTVSLGSAGGLDGLGRLNCWGHGLASSSMLTRPWKAGPMQDSGHHVDQSKLSCPADMAEQLMPEQNALS